MENTYKHLLHHYLKDIVDSHIKELSFISEKMDFNFHDAHSSYKKCTIEDSMMRLITAVIPVMKDMREFFPEHVYTLNWFESKYEEYRQRPDINICRCIGCVTDRSLKPDNDEAEFGVHPVPLGNPRTFGAYDAGKAGTFDCKNLKLIKD